MRPETKRSGRRFRNIKAWQRADRLVSLVYTVTQTLPIEERYGITSQMRRAAVSAAANIVEGASRHSRLEYLQFLSVAKGSLNELSYYIHLARRLGYITEARFQELDEQYDETARTLYGLMQSVSREARSTLAHA